VHWLKTCVHVCIGWRYACMCALVEDMRACVHWLEICVHWSAPRCRYHRNYLLLMSFCYQLHTMGLRSPANKKRTCATTVTTERNWREAMNSAAAAADGKAGWLWQQRGPTRGWIRRFVEIRESNMNCFRASKEVRCCAVLCDSLLIAVCRAKWTTPKP